MHLLYSVCLLLLYLKVFALVQIALVQKEIIAMHKIVYSINVIFNITLNINFKSGFKFLFNLYIFNI